MPDIYQKRYLEHQEAKKNRIATEPKKEYTDAEIMTVFKVMSERRSQRIFNGDAIDADRLGAIIKAASLAPSSCNRQAVSIKTVRSEPMKNDLGRLLVGGKGWVDGADTVLLLFANMAAYKSPAEVDFMPFLDAGFVAENIYLICEALSIGACFVNPNIREADKGEFNALFIPDGHRFCGAMALGCYEAREAKRKYDKL